MQSPINHLDLETCGMIIIPPMSGKCSEGRHAGAVTRVQYDEIYFYRHRDGRVITTDGQSGQVLSSVIVWFDADGVQVGNDWQITSNLLPEYLRGGEPTTALVDPVSTAIMVA